ncbi:hypothetical protein HAV15_011396 [Penicillium sp. str. |nr:hypothetical protein HAV15_011396 [Penicillium sp. str. \
MDPLTPYCRELASPGIFQPVLSVYFDYPRHPLLIPPPTHPHHLPTKLLRHLPILHPPRVTSGTSAFANILVFPSTAQDVACCQEISGIACFAGLLGVFQVAMQWLCFFSILLLFVIYFPRATSPTDPVDTVSSTSSGPTYRTALVITGICLLHALATIVISPSGRAAPAGRCLGLGELPRCSSCDPRVDPVLPADLHYLPVALRGELEYPHDTPGSLVWAASLAARKGWSGWSIWGVLVVTACLQGTLLTMAIYFEYFGSNDKREFGQPANQNGAANGSALTGESAQQEFAHEERPSEETPLLQSQ